MKRTASIAIVLSVSVTALFAQTNSQPTSRPHHLRDSRIAAPVDWSRLKAQGAVRRYATNSAAAVITRDNIGRVTQVLEPDPQGKPTLQTDITYDAQGKVVKIIQHGARNDTPRIRSFVYDVQSRVISATSPEAGTIAYTYDANGNIATRTDARNLTITYNGTQNTVYSARRIPMAPLPHTLFMTAPLSLLLVELWMRPWIGAFTNTMAMVISQALP